MYPLVFVRSPSSEYKFIGTWEFVQDLNERRGMDSSFSEVFRDVIGVIAAAPAPAASIASPLSPVEGNSEETPLPPGWTQCVTKDGKVYYANKATKVNRIPFVCVLSLRYVWRERV